MTGLLTRTLRMTQCALCALGLTALLSGASVLVDDDTLACAAYAQDSPCNPQPPPVPAAGRFTGTFTLNWKSEGQSNLLFDTQTEGLEGDLILYVEDNQAVEGPLKASFTSTGDFKGIYAPYSSTGTGDASAFLKGGAAPGKSFKSEPGSTWNVYRTDKLGHHSQTTGHPLPLEFMVVDAKCTRMQGIINTSGIDSADPLFNPLQLPSFAVLEASWKAELDGASDWEDRVDEKVAGSLAAIPHTNLIRDLLQMKREIEFTGLPDGAKKCLGTKLLNAAIVIDAKRIGSALQRGSAQEILALAKELEMIGFGDECPLIKQAIQQALKLAVANLKETEKGNNIVSILQALRDAELLGLSDHSPEAQDAMTAVGNILNLEMDMAIKTGNRDLVIGLTQEALMLGNADVEAKGEKYLGL